MTGHAIQPATDNRLQAAAAYQELVDLTLATVAPSSARVYRQTLNKWQTWCHENGLSPVDLLPANVLAFLSGDLTTKATRQRQLSALRKIAQMAFILNPGDDYARRIHEALKVIKAPVPDQEVTDRQERTQRALSPAEADKLLRVWDGATDQHKRNRTLVAVLLLSGVRRSEAAGLQWRDIDFDNGVITVRHGKGDKRREAPLAGEWALEALRDWQCVISARLYVFCSVKKNGQIGLHDKPITGTDVYRIWRAACERAGVDSTKPHDARRTFITEGLETGTPLHTMQQLAGHQRGDTTLRYAKSVSARRARKRLRLRYG